MAPTPLKLDSQAVEAIGRLVDEPGERGAAQASLLAAIQAPHSGRFAENDGEGRGQ
jgi:hypothetical protein